MLPEIWKPNVTVLFVGTVVAELSDRLGFYYLHPRNRFWEMLVVGGITPKQIITVKEAKALAEGHAGGSLTDPVKAMFIEKKTEQLLRDGIGLTDLNRRVVVSSDKDKLAKPTEEDIRAFIGKVEELTPRVLAFVTSIDIFVDSFKKHYQGVTGTLGLQPFTIGNSEVWLLGSTSGLLRGEALTRQEDAFFALGERIQALGGMMGER